MIKLVDTNKKSRKFFEKFSYFYFFFGPFYTLYRKKFTYSILLVIYNFIMIPRSIVISILSSWKLGDNLIAVLAYPHTTLDIFTTILLTFIPHLILSFFIEKYFIKQAINKKNMLPASDLDLEKLKKISKQYGDLPVDPSYLAKLSFVESSNRISNHNLENRKSVLDLGKDNLKNSVQKVYDEDLNYRMQDELDIIYSKYQMGLLSEKELLEEKKKILNKR